MKLLYALTTALLLSGSAVLAETPSQSFASAIERGYLAAGYSNIVVTRVDGTWYVTADFNGVTRSFQVDKRTGASTVVDAAVISTVGSTQPVWGANARFHSAKLASNGMTDGNLTKDIGQYLGDGPDENDDAITGQDASGDVNDDYLTGQDASGDISDDDGMSGGDDPADDASDDHGDDTGSDDQSDSGED